MISRLRSHFGTAGLVVAIVALIAALAGGALAANSGGGHSATASKAKQGKPGKPGKPGPPGPAGPMGPAGAVGPAGPAGAKGDPGTAGTNGTDGEDGQDGQNGTSVTTNTVSTAGEEGHCAGVGGARFVAGAGKTFACTGKEGEPWTAGGTLPPGKTETGAWGFEASRTLYEGSYGGVAPISFTLPLAAPLDISHVHYINPAGKEITLGEAEVDSAVCHGTTNAPQADAGNLCVYAGRAPHVVLYPGNIQNLTEYSGGASRTGAYINSGSAVLPTQAGEQVSGSWAVTAP